MLSFIPHHTPNPKLFVICQWFLFALLSLYHGMVCDCLWICCNKLPHRPPKHLFWNPEKTAKGIGQELEKEELRRRGAKHLNAPHCAEFMLKNTGKGEGVRIWRLIVHVSPMTSKCTKIHETMSMMAWLSFQAPSIRRGHEKYVNVYLQQPELCAHRYNVHGNLLIIKRGTKQIVLRVQGPVWCWCFIINMARLDCIHVVGAGHGISTFWKTTYAIFWLEGCLAESIHVWKMWVKPEETSDISKDPGTPLETFSASHFPPRLFWKRISYHSWHEWTLYLERVMFWIFVK